MLVKPLLDLDAPRSGGCGINFYLLCHFSPPFFEIKQGQGSDADMLFLSFGLPLAFSLCL